MKNQYMILILCCILRIALDVFTIIIFGFVYGNLLTQECKLDKEPDNGI